MSIAFIVADLIAISVLVFGTFLPRHKRRDLVAAYLGVNIGVLAVATALASSTVSAGLGLGLFGVLSIIRLRSEELSQREIAYYFAALALGLLGGLGGNHQVWIIGLMAAIVAAVWLGDSSLVVGKSVRQNVLLDRAITDPLALRAYAVAVLGGEVHDVSVVKTDLVNDTTLVIVRHTPRAANSAAPVLESVA